MVDTYSPDMTKDGYGDWVKLEDYEALELERDILNNEIEGMRDQVCCLQEDVSDLESELSELRWEVSQLQALGN